MRLFFKLIIIFFLSYFKVSAQNAFLSGTIYNENNVIIPFASVYSETDRRAVISDSSGNFKIELKAGKNNLIVSGIGYSKFITTVNLKAGETKQRKFILKHDTTLLSEVVVSIKKENTWDVQRLGEAEGTTIYAGKKNEVIVLDKLNANTATNNMRQLYAKVPGINVIENDASGVQLSVATRGLNPNRTTEFNTRQNGYDISADPIGYPESYYTPPTDALERIEVVRGAASLQYGTQFGGLLNLKFKQPNPNKPMEIFSKQTIGSYGFFNSFNSLNGTYKKISYYAFYNYKRSDGWRQNSGFDLHSAYGSLNYHITEKLTLSAEFTFMNYVMKQPGGLTDAEFLANPKLSYRNRNWFSANWNLPALVLNYNINCTTKLNIKTYSLFAHRFNVGDINKITIADTGGNRTVMSDYYRNLYTEARLMHHYKLFKNSSAILLGIRAYSGNTQRQQGNGTSGSDASFNFVNKNNLALNFHFPSYNFAFFAENVFRISSKFSITPGIRYELIETNSIGSYTNVTAPNVTRKRSFPLLGLGLNYKVIKHTDLYANFSQNYSPVNFSDITVSMPAYKVDPALKDVKGYNADIGYRGAIGRLVNFDLSAYYMAYNNRIDNTQRVDENDNTYTYRTNIADSRSVGAETYVELNLIRFFTKKDSAAMLNVYSSVSYTDARYVSKLLLYDDKRVAFAPHWIRRYGLSFSKKKLSASLQYSYISNQFTDATNAIYSSDGSVGLIPAYYIVDFSANYSYKKFLFGFSVNNLTNNHYFTRRTPTAFPGPGIIPSDARGFFVSVGIKI